ncbi:Alkanal monooxygenase alpha chain [Mesomycoplasma neurolyticum]|uniref:Alkanal monooxygenase alpha chain n=2 Tax=Mesomycoplasma neurolyticum TaxID=2120 RepID=A0A449A5T2_9BACT|nr:Alkanal monooxygenase alpha chain [Mesomycoplasma neurolyticum]
MEYGLIDINRSSEEAFKNIEKTAILAEKLNFDTIWFAEHHNVYSLGLSNPLLAMAYIANKTKKINLGSAGILLCHYAPYKIAEDIFSLQIFNFKRFKFGIGSNPGLPPVQLAMNTTLNYHEKFLQLLHYLKIKKMTLESDNVISIPYSENKPDIWMLVSSVEGATFAAENNLKMIYGFFLNSNYETFEKALKIYKTNWKNSFSKPEIAFAINIIIEENKEKAKKLAESFDVYLLGKNDFNEFKHFPDLKDIKNYKYDTKDLETIKNTKNKTIFGDSKIVKEKIMEIANKYQINHFVACQLLPNYKQRLKNLKFISKTFELTKE